MITCHECGSIYDEAMRKCPECGNPTKLTLNSSDLAACPSCGAELHTIQGYNFVCDFCGTTAPIDKQTRAKIDAAKKEQIRQERARIRQERAIIRQERSRIRKRRAKRILLTILFFIIAAIAFVIWLYTQHYL